MMKEMKNMMKEMKNMMRKDEDYDEKRRRGAYVNITCQFCDKERPIGKLVSSHVWFSNLTHEAHMFSMISQYYSRKGLNNRVYLHIK